MLNTVTTSLPLSITCFIVAAIAIALAGIRLTRVADKLADKTGWGEALVGAIFLGGSTSLPGIITSVTAALDGRPSLAVSNAVGGIAAQTVFLALADLTYPKANLEHAAASVANLTQGTLLITLLAVPLLAMFNPAVTLYGVHPASILLIVGYIFGLRLVSQAKTKPMWSPEDTEDTQVDEAAEEVSDSMLSLWLQFLPLMLVIGSAGYVVAKTGGAIASQTGLSETVVGSMLTAISTSLPELVTAIAAVQQGALTLAIGDIIGGNCFDVLFVAFADIAYSGGSIYHAISGREGFIIALTILMTGSLLLGLLRRERYGIGKIGFESFLIIMLYVGGVIIVFSTQ
ncbi:MAG: sodium:calcium antiporter [Cyanobacteria bacterium P01_A01_bin.135]